MWTKVTMTTYLQYRRVYGLLEIRDFTNVLRTNAATFPEIKITEKFV